MVAESVVTGGVIAVALAAIEVAKAAIHRKRNGSHNSSVQQCLTVATKNGAKIDANTRQMESLATEMRTQVSELRHHTTILTAIKTIVERNGGRK